jgi:hypothetical protein
MIAISSANPTFIVNADTGVDLVITSGSNTFDSEAVLPSGAANIHVEVNGGGGQASVTTPYLRFAHRGLPATFAAHGELRTLRDGVFAGNGGRALLLQGL